MTRDTDQDWTAIAEQTPFWGVLSLKEYEGKELEEEARLKFYASGEEFVGNLFSLIRNYFEPEFAPATILDFGCGVGRLLVPFAKRCLHATGIDIAPEMRRICEEHAHAAGITNIRVCASDDEITQTSEQYDLVNTYIVIQHIPPERGIFIINSLCQKIKIGGYGSIQLTYAKSTRFIQNEYVGSQYYRRDASFINDLTPRCDPSHPVITMFDYDLNSVFAILQQFSGSPMICLPTNDDGHLGIHIIFKRAR